TLKSRPASNQLWGAVMVVVTADLVLSLDNVVALAAATQGSVLFLVLGLLLSIPLLMYGSLFINRLLGNYPLLVPAGSALLAWLAGQIAVSDPLVASWVETQAPALSVVVPMLCVVFVLCESRIIREQRQGLMPPPPLNLFSGIAQRLSRLGEADTPDATQPQYEQATLSPVLVEAQPTVVESRLPMTFSEVVDVTPAAKGLPQAVALPGEAFEDEEEAASSTPEARLLKVLIWGAIVIGVLGLGWILTHLMSQGFLPTPEHPFKPQAYSR
ncbi:MAG TPA: hypothetical protein VJ575_00390, partial [Pseudogulbenkiania sp.]|nr:hypothetical protein [Pseudogulbenkiania sp.]